MGTAETIRASRIRAGKSAQQVAAELGLNDAWYRDIEANDDELATTLSLFQAMHLASLLNVQLHDFFPDEIKPREAIEIIDLPKLIEAHLDKNEISIDAFEEQIGWELRDFLHSPVKTTAELPIAFIQALCRALRINWMAVIPAEGAT